MHSEGRFVDSLEVANTTGTYLVLTGILSYVVEAMSDADGRAMVSSKPGNLTRKLSQVQTIYVGHPTAIYHGDVGERGGTIVTSDVESIERISD